MSLLSRTPEPSHYMRGSLLTVALLAPFAACTCLVDTSGLRDKPGSGDGGGQADGASDAGGGDAGGGDGGGGDAGASDAAGTDAGRDAGPDAGCTPGSCDPGVPCHSGVIQCPAGTCTDTGAVANGTSCGPKMYCHSGTCVACSPGDPCTASSECLVGRIDCSQGLGTCQDSGNQPNGTPCASGAKVCENGSCIACIPGSDCPPPGNACHIGTLDCATGTCTDTLANEPNGHVCAVDKVCFNGSCNLCTAGATCVPANPCHVGATVCTSGQPVCSDTAANVPDGTSCGSNKYCNAGTCNACTPGASCPGGGNPCHVGVVDCTTGLSACKDMGSQPDGTVCTGGLCCAGNCSAGCCPACAGVGCGSPDGCGGTCRNGSGCLCTLQSPGPETLCDDGCDNDGNGQVDCNDAACQNRPCSPSHACCQIGALWVCTDITTPTHCGGCGLTCAPSHACQKWQTPDDFACVCSTTADCPVGPGTGFQQVCQGAGGPCGCQAPTMCSFNQNCVAGVGFSHCSY